ncbi:MAG: prepilin-type N-terminal cleavage/methylation domain-containing protein [Verrucomicrobiaceae bacterium]|nr:MAG: prepilin-type N-terminal cleavage/methylation domain-containing protein [Verrucomicrobiaceae bacterium]
MKAAIRRSRARGYTLIELTLAMAVGVIISAIIMALVNQQLTFLKIFRTQSFLVTEAPMLNNYITKIVGNADSYMLYSSVDDLVAGRPQVLKEANVIMLRFKEPNGTFRASVLSFEDPGTGSGLYYRMVNTSGVLGAPSWALSRKPANVEFAIDTGILRVTVEGPNGEQIIYSGASQL